MENIVLFAMGQLLERDLFKDIVYDGILKDNGMSSFSDVLSENDVESIYHYIVNTAKIDRQVQLEQNN